MFWGNYLNPPMTQRSWRFLHISREGEAYKHWKTFNSWEPKVFLGWNSIQSPQHSQEKAIYQLKTGKTLFERTRKHHLVAVGLPTGSQGARRKQKAWWCSEVTVLNKRWQKSSRIWHQGSEEAMSVKAAGTIGSWDRTDSLWGMKWIWNLTKDFRIGICIRKKNNDVGARKGPRC